MRTLQDTTLEDFVETHLCKLCVWQVKRKVSGYSNSMTATTVQQQLVAGKHNYHYRSPTTFVFWTFGLYRLSKLQLLQDPSNSSRSCWAIRTAVPERQNVSYVS